MEATQGSSKVSNETNESSKQADMRNNENRNANEVARRKRIKYEKVGCMHCKKPLLSFSELYVCLQVVNREHFYKVL